MPTVTFTANLRRHIDCPDGDVEGTTVREALEAVFATTPRLRSYILDDNGAIRPHVNIFLDGAMIEDRARQSDAVGPTTSLYVVQSLSGG